MVETNSNKKFREMDFEEKMGFIAKINPKFSETSKKILKNWAEAEVPLAENHVAFARTGIGVIPGILVNDRRFIVPMVTEEASIIAGVSNAVKISEKGGGFKAIIKGTTTPGQIQVVKIPNGQMEEVIFQLKKNEKVLIAIGNSATPHLVEAGGGVLSINPRKIETKVGPQLIVNIEVDCKDAMGAAAVSKIAEAMAPKIERITGGTVITKVLSNLTPGRLVTVDATFDKESLALKKEVEGEILKISGNEMVERIVLLSAWAEVDQFRATTHNKGIMNGITSTGVALGQDTRALEADAHSYAALGRPYGPLSYFEIDANGNLHGHLEVPISVGVVGGAVISNSLVKANLNITGCESSTELAEVMGAVALAQNLAALRMLAGEGITIGHGTLHKERAEGAIGLRQDQNS